MPWGDPQNGSFQRSMPLLPTIYILPLLYSCRPCTRGPYTSTAASCASSLSIRLRYYASASSSFPSILPGVFALVLLLWPEVRFLVSFQKAGTFLVVSLLLLPLPSHHPSSAALRSIRVFILLRLAALRDSSKRVMLY